MHNAAFRALGVEYVYVAFGTDDTAGAVAAMRSLGLRGLGVTMPNKQRIAPLLDRLDPVAKAVGAVNTVVNDAGVLTGHNVDGDGFLRAIDDVSSAPVRRAAVVGAGGGARAIVHALVGAGAEVLVYNRDAERGRKLAADLQAAFAGPPHAVAEADGLDLLAHVTPVGFEAPDDMLVPMAALRRDLIVFDAVPRPVETRLLREAKEMGCATVPGVRMQLHQAARQFALYTGRDPDLRVMDRALADAIVGT